MKNAGAMERRLRLDEKKSFISGGFVVYMPPLMLRANTINWKLYHHLSLSFFEKIRLPDIPKDIPRHTPIPIPAMLFKTFIKTTLQSIAAVIPIVTPIIILLLFISFILHKFLFIEQSIPYSSIKEYPDMKNVTVLLYTCFARFSL